MGHVQSCRNVSLYSLLYRWRTCGAIVVTTTRRATGHRFERKTSGSTLTYRSSAWDIRSHLPHHHHQ